MTSKPPVEWEISLSDPKWPFWGGVLLGLMLLFTWIGARNSPTDEAGKPILLLPGVKAVEDYRKVARAWVEDLATLDGEITQILEEDLPGDFFTQAQSAQKTLEHAVRLAQQIDQTHVPPVGGGLHEKLSVTMMSYLEAARSTLQWVSAPEDEVLKEALGLIQEARTARQALEDHPWIIAP